MVEMIVPTGNHPAAPRHSGRRRAFPVRRQVAPPQPPATTSGQAGQVRPEDDRKDRHIRSRSRWLAHNAGSHGQAALLSLLEHKHLKSITSSGLGREASGG